MEIIYFDNSATTPLCSEAKEAMIQAMDCYGNPSSLHSLGVEAEKIISEAKHKILASLGIRCNTKIGEKQLIFTASGTEADNLALIGTANAKAFTSKKKIIATDSEHPAILESLKSLEKRGFEILLLPTTGGIPDFGLLEKSVDKNTILVTMMLVNNETGALYDVARASRIVKSINPDTIVHTDCVQGYLKTPFSVKSLGVDMLTVSGHKIGASKGVGTLYVSEDVLKTRKLSPVIFGGGQENGIRSGTENVIGIAGFGAAAQAGFRNLAANIQSTGAVRDYIIREIGTNPAFDGVKLNIPKGRCTSHILSICLPSIKSETMLHSLSREGIFVSSGSACSSNTGHGSYVLKAFGLTEKEADCSIRLSFGPQNTVDQAKRFLEVFEKSLNTLVRAE